MRAINRLSAVKIAGLKRPGYYADGGNLYLRWHEGLDFSLHYRGQDA